MGQPCFNIVCNLLFWFLHSQISDPISSLTVFLFCFTFFYSFLTLKCCGRCQTSTVHTHKLVLLNCSCSFQFLCYEYFGPKKKIKNIFIHFFLLFVDLRHNSAVCFCKCVFCVYFANGVHVCAF